MAEELLVEAEQTPVTRKKLLKRAGVGALALGALPMIGASPAWAQPRNRCLEGSRDPAGNGTGCSNACTSGQCISACSADGACYCLIQTNGCCVCVDITDPSYSCTSTCTKNGDCPRGYACIDAGCCGGAGPGICVKKCTRPAGVAAAASVPPPLGR